MIDLGHRGILIAGLMDGDSGAADATPALWLCAHSLDNNTSTQACVTVRETGRRDLKPGNGLG